MITLTRFRWYAYDIKGVSSWKLKIHTRHKNIKYVNQCGVVSVTLSNNNKLNLDKISPLKKENDTLYCSGFLETQKPINGQLMCYREEWEIKKK